MAGQDLARYRQPGGQHDATAERPDPRGDRADDRELRRPIEFAWRDDERRAQTALLATDPRIEIGAQQIASLGKVEHVYSTISRPLSGPQSKASRIASGVTPSNRSASAQRRRAGL